MGSLIPSCVSTLSRSTSTSTTTGTQRGTTAADNWWCERLKQLSSTTSEGQDPFERHTPELFSSSISIFFATISSALSLSEPPHPPTNNHACPRPPALYPHQKHTQPSQLQGAMNRVVARATNPRSHAPPSDVDEPATDRSREKEVWAPSALRWQLPRRKSGLTVQSQRVLAALPSGSGAQIPRSDPLFTAPRATPTSCTSAATLAHIRSYRPPQPGQLCACCLRGSPHTEAALTSHPVPRAVSCPRQPRDGS